MKTFFKRLRMLALGALPLMACQPVTASVSQEDYADQVIHTDAERSTCLVSGNVPIGLDFDFDGYYQNLYCMESGQQFPVPVATTGGDCNDTPVTGALIHPLALEVCNSVDDNCDGAVDNGCVTQATTCAADVDQDGYSGGTIASVDATCGDAAGEAHPGEPTGDCNDITASVHPGATEICDGLDNNCNLTVDEGLSGTDYYPDADGDTYGAATATAVNLCAEPAGFVSNKLDCDDTRANVHPGATEIVGDSLDNDCNPATLDTSGGNTTWYLDSDHDGYGNYAQYLVASVQPAGYVSTGGDCNDSNPAIHPGATEIIGDGVDNNCDGITDSNGTGTYYRDLDADGFGSTVNGTSTTLIAGYVTNNTDCNDNNAAVYPGHPEVNNGIDDNCDGVIDNGTGSTTWYRDQDSDGYGNPSLTELSNTQPVGYVSNATDCNDNSYSIHPGATEVCNGLDDNCNAVIDEGANSITYYRDADGDSYGTSNTTTAACTAPSGYVSQSGDCNDSVYTIHPYATETCNSVDDNCDGLIDNGATGTITWYRDLDADGYGSTAYGTTTACTQPAGYLSTSTDCNDNNYNVHPYAPEVANNGVDDNCDGVVDNGTQTGNCPAGQSQFTATYQMPTGSTYVDTYGSAQGGGVNEFGPYILTTGYPSGMTITTSGTTVTIADSSCVSDNALWRLSIHYMNASWIPHWSCEGKNPGTLTGSMYVTADGTQVSVSPATNMEGTGCDTTFK